MNKKVLYSFFVSFLLFIAVTVINRRSFNEMKEYTQLVGHTQEVITALEELSNHFKSAQIYSPSYKNIPEREYYNLLQKEVLGIHPELNNLKSLVKDNKDQVKRIDSLSNYINAQYNVLLVKNISEIIASGETWRLKQLVLVNQTIKQAIETETNLLALRRWELGKSTRLTGLLTILFSIIATLIIVFTFLNTLFLTRRRRWLEGFLESVLNTSQNGIVTYKAVREGGKIVDFKIEFANDAIEDLLGIKPKDVIGKRMKDLPPYVQSVTLLQRYINVVETGKQMEFETLYNNGKIERWFNVLLARRADGLTATFHNISKIKRYEEELKNNIKQLKHSNSELEQYAYVASHDLQEPLRKIRTFANILEETQKEKLDEKGNMHLKKIRSAAERMSVLITDILSFSGLKKEAVFVPTDLNEVLKNIAQDLELLIVQKEAVIEKEPLPVIDAIPLQMNQLFYNLINNALKFTKANTKPIIRITTRNVPPEEAAKNKTLLQGVTYCEIVFNDNGLGFNQSFAEQIFGLFKRLNDRQSFSGSGIGLALCRKVVTNHNGIIYAQSAEGRGATFHILLPLQQPKYAAAGA